MCERRGRFLAIGAVTLAVMAATPLAAQSDVDYLRRQSEALAQRRALVGKRLDSLRRVIDHVLDDSLVAGSHTVRFASTQVPEADRATIRATLEAESAKRTAEFGASAALMSGGLAWKLEENRMRRSATRGYRLEYAPANGGARNDLLSRPIDPRPLVVAAQYIAASNATRLHPTTKRYLNNGASFDDTGEEQARAAESLALAGSATGRRCIRGSLADCRLVLAGTVDMPYLQRFYEPSDYPALVARQRRPPPNAPASWTRDRERCLEEKSAAACEAIVPFVGLRYPFAAAVRGTFFVEALRTGGEAGLQRLVAARESYADDPIGLLAHVANLPEDSLIVQWQRHIAEQGRLASRDPLAPVLLTSLAWSGLLLFGATLRRPR